MPANEKAAVLLDELAALDAGQRREVATTLGWVAEIAGGVPDGRHTALMPGGYARSRRQLSRAR